MFDNVKQATKIQEQHKSMNEIYIADMYVLRTKLKKEATVAANSRLGIDKARTAKLSVLSLILRTIQNGIDFLRGHIFRFYDAKQAKAGTKMASAFAARKELLRYIHEQTK